MDEWKTRIQNQTTQQTKESKLVGNVVDDEWENQILLCTLEFPYYGCCHKVNGVSVGSPGIKSSLLNCSKSVGHKIEASVGSRENSEQEGVSVVEIIEDQESPAKAARRSRHLRQTPFPFDYRWDRWRRRNAENGKGEKDKTPFQKKKQKNNEKDNGREGNGDTENKLVRTMMMLLLVSNPLPITIIVIIRAEKELEARERFVREIRSSREEGISPARESEERLRSWRESSMVTKGGMLPLRRLLEKSMKVRLEWRWPGRDPVRLALEMDDEGAGGFDLAAEDSEGGEVLELGEPDAGDAAEAVDGGEGGEGGGEFGGRRTGKRGQLRRERERMVERDLRAAAVSWRWFVRNT
ncbi:hypothetical protein V8G54_011147 [Vigna mungo]|uniref:Uncharacterized protein n=1 Tax=Vigna mungo TaxID=3915 RepID=A0AAQ3NRG4_VIGMU